MCVVSMVSDFYRQTYPNPSEWTRIRWEEYQELLRKAAEYDRINGERDCVDPKKKEFTDEVERILREKGLIK